MCALRNANLLEMQENLPPEFQAAEAASWLESWGYRAPFKALEALEREGAIVRLKRGLYAFVEGFEPLAAAAKLHEPSYVSFETALAYYGLIPERVMTVLSVVDGRPATFDTSVGRYEFYSQSRPLFAAGMSLVFIHDRVCPIANREKALLDTLARARLRAAKLKPAQVLQFVREGLRVDEAGIEALALDKLARMAPLYRNSAPRQFVQALEAQS